jgi:hypothetical protein
LEKQKKERSPLKYFTPISKPLANGAMPGMELEGGGMLNGGGSRIGVARQSIRKARPKIYEWSGIFIFNKIRKIHKNLMILI